VTDCCEVERYVLTIIKRIIIIIIIIIITLYIINRAYREHGQRKKTLLVWTCVRPMYEWLTSAYFSKHYRPTARSRG